MFRTDRVISALPDSGSARRIPSSGASRSRLHVVLALVAVIDVVGVLPDVERQQAARCRAPSACRRCRWRRPRACRPCWISQAQPQPNWPFAAAANLSAECARSCRSRARALAQRAGGLARLRRQRMPVEIVVPGLRGVVEELAGGSSAPRPRACAPAHRAPSASSWFMVSTYFLWCLPWWSCSVSAEMTGASASSAIRQRRQLEMQLPRRLQWRWPCDVS